VYPIAAKASSAQARASFFRRVLAVMSSNHLFFFLPYKQTSFFPIFFLVSFLGTSTLTNNRKSHKE